RFDALGLIEARRHDGDADRLGDVAHGGEPGTGRAPKRPRRQVRLCSRRMKRLTFGAGLAALCAWLAVVSAWEASAQRRLGPGQERVVLGLFAPHELGGEVAAGYALWNVSIEQSRVVVTLRAGDGSETTVTLVHPDDAPE